MLGSQNDEYSHESTAALKDSRQQDANQDTGNRFLKHREQGDKFFHRLQRFHGLRHHMHSEEDNTKAHQGITDITVSLLL